MTVSDSYIEYKRLLTDKYQPQLRYRGESIIKRLQGDLKDVSAVWLIWDKEDGLECCKGVKSGDSFSITEVVDLIDFSERCCLGSDSIFDSKVQSWLNLCHHEDGEGNVHYDSYYDRYPINDGDGTHSGTVGELRTAVNRLITDNLPFQAGDTVFFDGMLSQSNLIKELLQRSGYNILKRDSKEKSKETETSSYDSAANINLFVMGSNSMIVVPMPTGRELAVYDVPVKQKQLTEPPTMKFQRLDADLLGNVWLTTRNADGSSGFRLYPGEEVAYSEIKSD